MIIQYGTYIVPSSAGADVLITNWYSLFLTMYGAKLHLTIIQQPKYHIVLSSAGEAGAILYL